jgi:adenylate cyclase
MESGRTPDEIRELTSQFKPDLMRAMDEALIAVLHGQQANAWLRNLLASVEYGLARAGLYERPVTMPAICFLDLTGYSRLTDEKGDEAAADLAARLGRLVQRSASRHGGQAVKWLGDGVMFHFGRAGEAVVAALEMVQEAEPGGLPPAHVGVHAGPVLYQAGDYFGRTVNIASRIADYARQGEVLVSQQVVEASDSSGVMFSEIGPVELRGLSGALRLHAAHMPTEALVVT